MNPEARYAPGWPGIPPRWTSSDKTGVGTALNPLSRVWFTVSHGILNEIYYPRVDQACTRDLGLIVTDGSGFFSQEKRHALHEAAGLAEGVPAYRLVNTCEQGRYRIEKEVLSDPRREAVLQRIRFVPLKGSLLDYHLYALLAPHVGNRGYGNTGWVGDYKGTPMLFAERDGNALALAASILWARRSVGFVGASDGYQDLIRHHRMEWVYTRAENGNVALCGELDLSSGGTEFVLAIGFGRTWAEAGFRALASLQDGFSQAREAYIKSWQEWQNTLVPLKETVSRGRKLFSISAAVLRTHEETRFPGGIIASLSIPWGFTKGDEDLGGYHLVWPRDLVEAAGGLLAAGAGKEVKRVLHYLEATQEADGYWPQNMWLDGTPYWGGVQMDEIGFPILLVDLARRKGVLYPEDLAHFWPMVRKAAGYLIRNGPVTQQDRWEEDPGYSPFTLAVEVASLLGAADLAELFHEPAVAGYLREAADAWNESIERWTYATGTDLARQLDVEGYYVRLAPPESSGAASPIEGFVPIKNRAPGMSAVPADRIISPDVLALVRFGLRAPDDPRILNTVRVIDYLLKLETPHGPAWHRYNGDGYGEHEDGKPYDGSGVGRAWPLLTGERAHYELAAGRKDLAEQLLKSLEAFANEGGMIPEQIWDGEDIPARELFFGKASGSAMPLVWAHAEYLKLCRSLEEGALFDQPPQPVQRYQVQKVGARYALWRFNQKCRTIPPGNILRLETLAPSVVHWSLNGWRTVCDTPARDTGLGIYFADLPTESLAPGAVVLFTFYWPGAGRWEGRDFEIPVK